jgi:hypothetical protein
MWLGRLFEDGSLIIRQFVVFSHDYIIIDELGHPYIYLFNNSRLLWNHIQYAR